MASLIKLTRQPEFQVFVSCLLFVLINWPFLSIPAGSGITSLFSYLFLVWGGFIVLLYLIQKNLDGDSDEEKDDEGGG